MRARARSCRLTNPAIASPALARLFGPAIATAELRGTADAALLDPAEAACCTGFAPKRIADFTAGRLCARRALAALGVAASAVTVNADRTPRWPPQIVGSISHTAAFCCAAVARQADARSIGVDAEVIGGVTAELNELLFTESEIALLSALPDGQRRIAATLFFSAKESFYKCQYPITRAWIDFHEATIVPLTADWTGGSFRIDTDYRRFGLDAVAPLPLHGRFVVEGDLLLTGVALHQGASAGSPSSTSA
jgi:4'-phosphopantetheinyl transferase EntD